MTDKIKEELEKEIEDKKKILRGKFSLKSEGSNVIIPLPKEEDFEMFRQEQIAEAKLAQHLATKQAMIKDEIEFLGRRKHLLYSTLANTLLDNRDDIKLLIKETEERLTKLKGELK